MDRSQNFLHVLYSLKSHFAPSQKIIMSSDGSYFYQMRTQVAKMRPWGQPKMLFPNPKINRMRLDPHVRRQSRC